MKPLRVLVVGWTATTGGIEHFFDGVLWKNEPRTRSIRLFVPF